MIISPSDRNLFEAIDFKNEKELQDYIEQSPKILNVISAINQQDYPLLILGREYGVHSGSIDFIATDIEGSLYIIETKLAENPELRRKVIGQVIEYASDLTDVPYDSFAKKCCEYLRSTDPLEEAICNFYTGKIEDDDEIPNAGEYRKTITANLAGGRFNLVIVTNQVGFEIQKLFHYIDQITRDNVNFIVLEINKYQIDSNPVLHSSIVWAAKYIKALFSRTLMKEQEFITAKAPHVQKLVKHVDEMCAAKGLSKVTTTKGLSWKSASGGSVFITGNTLSTNWSTFPRTAKHSKELTVFKEKVMKAATESGLETVPTKHGVIRLKLSEQIQIEFVDKFIELAFSVMDKAESIENAGKN